MDGIRKVFIAGGTGFLGAPAAQRLRALGVETRSASLSGGENCDKLNLFEESESSLSEYFANIGADALVYALGPDERQAAPAPAYKFFRERLAEQCGRICRAAKRAGAKKLVVFGSYFSHFDALLGGKLSKAHPYIRARRDQEWEVLSLNGEGCAALVLQLPYIFGVNGGRTPIWRESLLSHYDGFGSVFIPRGGTAATTAEGVADAAAAAVLFGEGGVYPVGGVNLTYKELFIKMLRAAGDGRKVHTVPAFLAAPGARLMTKNAKADGREPGLNYAKLMTQVFPRRFYLDGEQTARALHFEKLGFFPVRDVDAAIGESMRACYPERFGGK